MEGRSEGIGYGVSVSRKSEVVSRVDGWLERVSKLGNYVQYNILARGGSSTMDEEAEYLEYLRELQDQLGQNILELRELNYVIRAQYIRLSMYIVPAVVLASVIVTYAVIEISRGELVHPHSTIGGTLGVFGLFLLSELLTLAFGPLQSINRGNRIRYLQRSAIHDAETELKRAGWSD